MLNHVIDSNTTWGVSHNYDRNRVLIQLSDAKLGEMVRVSLTKWQAEQFLEKLKSSIEVIKNGSQE